MKLIYNSSQLVTTVGGAQRGHQLGALQIIPNGALAIQGDTILKVGTSADLLEKYPNAERIDAEQRAIVPGFVDPHTHLVWAGNRAHEYEMRLEGKSYMEIMAAGGGIAATVNATRKASLDELVAQAMERAQRAFAHGTTTMEAKSGYGLDLETEFRQLEAVLEINKAGPIELVPTYMGAHAIPVEFKGDTAGYTRWLCEVALPETKSWWLKHAPGQALPFVDVFCEKDVFEIEETREILQIARDLGFPLKLHADEFENLGGASLGAEFGAASVDHLVKTSLEDIQKMAQSETVAVSLPGTPFGLAQSEYSPAREMIAANAYLALATDLNPGTTWNESMQFMQALATRYMKLTPSQALAASTINSAKAVLRDATIGSIEAGKQADILILSVPDYRILTYRYGTNMVANVIKKGELYPQKIMWDFYPDIEDARAWYASAGLAHDFEHALRVLNLAMKIAENEAADLEIVYVAALLHDSRGATPGGEDGARMGHHLASAQFAGEILAQVGWKKERIEAVQHCIRAHRYRHDGEQPQSLEAQCVFDADKLDVLGAVGVARTIAYATHAGQPFYARPSEQFLNTGERFPDEPHSAYHEYLFKLRHVKDRLYTSTGKQIAAQREAILHKFFNQLQAECEGEA